MLYLDRSPGESIYIGREIEIKVVDVRRGDTVVIGITAPLSIPIRRPDARIQAVAASRRAGGETHGS